MEPHLHWYLVGVAALPSAAMAAGLVVLMFRRNINARMLMEMVKRLLVAGSADRAVKLCNAADCPATTLCFYLLGLEEPATVLEQREQEGGGYRDAGAQVREVPFAERVAALADREARSLLRSQVRGWGLAATIGGLLAFLLGLAAWLVAFPPTGWRPSWIDGVPLVGLLGAVHGLRVWRRVNAGVLRVAATLVPLLRPVEQMSDVALAAAEQARAAHQRRRAPRRAAASD